MWLERARVLLDDALMRFRAEDGGFFDTGSDAEALVARPRDPSDNASPSGLSATVHALAEYAALTGSGRHRQAAEEALATVAALAERAPRFAGWSLAAAEAMLDGPLEIAVVGPAGPDRDALAARARRVPGAVVVVADGPARRTCPCWSGGPRSTAAPRRTSAGTRSASARSPTPPTSPDPARDGTSAHPSLGARPRDGTCAGAVPSRHVGS